MHLPSAHDLSCLIHHAGKWDYLYLTDVAWTYRQLPLDLVNWQLVCFQLHGRFVTDLSLLFRLKWAASHCQDITSLITSELRR